MFDIYVRIESNEMLFFVFSKYLSLSLFDGGCIGVGLILNIISFHLFVEHCMDCTNTRFKYSNATSIIVSADKSNNVII